MKKEGEAVEEEKREKKEEEDKKEGKVLKIGEILRREAMVEEMMDESEAIAIRASEQLESGVCGIMNADVAENVRTRKRGERGKDAKKRKARRCMLCVKFSGQNPFSCKGAPPRGKCDQFLDNGTPVNSYK